MKKIHAFIFISLTFASTPAYAGIQSDMNNFVSSMGMSANFTPGGRYNSQSGGYATGGGMYVRSPVRNYQLLSATLPSIRAGCGGIDAYLGGFSFINVSQFTSMLRNIGNNALGYAFQLALLTVSPDIKSVLDNLQKMINAINSTNINSCHAAKRLVDGAVGALTEESDKGCAAIARDHGYASDYQAAVRWCQKPGHKDNAFYGTPLTAAEKEKQVVHKNLMWAALSKTYYANMPNSVREMLMSLTGTFIINQVAGTTKPRWNQPTGIKIKQLINGSQNVQIMDCGTDTGDCLPMNNGSILPYKTVAIPGLKVMVRTALDDIRNNLEQERMTGSNYILQPQTMNLIGLSKEPILKMLITAVAIGPSVGMEVENEMVAPVAFDIVASYLSWAYTAASNAAHGGIANVDKTTSNDFINNVQRAVDHFRALRASTNMITAIQALQKARFLDQVLTANMTPHFQQVFEFARGG